MFAIYLGGSKEINEDHVIWTERAGRRAGRILHVLLSDCQLHLFTTILRMEFSPGENLKCGDILCLSGWFCTISWWFNSICLMQGHHADTLILQLRCRFCHVSAPARDCGGTSLHPGSSEMSFLPKTIECKVLNQAIKNHATFIKYHHKPAISTECNDVCTCFNISTIILDQLSVDQMASASAFQWPTWKAIMPKGSQ